MALSAVRYTEIIEELGAIRRARLELIEGGQSVSIQGSHSYTRLRMEELNKQEMALKRELIALKRSEPERRFPHYEPQN